MNKLQELINELCPNGVEYKTIGDISKTLKKETLKTNELIEDGKYPVINSGREIYGFYNDYNNEGNAVTIAARGEYAGVINYFSDKFWAGGLCYPYTSINENILNTKFLYYYLKSKEKNIMETLVTRGSIPALNKNDLDKYKIAVPPLEVQREIVHILDDFTLLSAELSAELKARQKQYDFYKQKVFDSIKTKKIKHITDIALVKARVGWQRLTKSEYLNSGNYYLITGTDFTTDGNINFESCVYVSKDRYEMDKNIQVHKDDILITKDGTLGKVAILKEEPSKETTLNSGVFRIKVLDDKEVYPKYLYHFFTSKYFKDFVESVKTGSTIPHLTQQGLVTLDIPIPSLEEQIKLSGLLDNFDILTNDITEGLPAEIEARQKQYEYYRDKLLTFKELK